MSAPSPLPRRTASLVPIVLLTLLPALASCGEGADALPQEPEAVASVTLDADSLTLLVGEQEQLQSTVTGSRGGSLATTTTWRSLDPTVATVSTAGLVQAVAVGDTRVVASAEDRSDTAAVRVRDPSDLPSELAGTYRPVSFRIEPNETFTATGPVVIRTDGTLRVDGTLRFAPGATVALYSADSLVIGGSLEPLEAPAGTSSARSPRPVEDACGREEPADLILAGRYIFLAGDAGSIRSDGDVYIAAATSDGLISGGKSIFAGRGSRGCKDHPGGRGHDVDIGGPVAVAAVADATEAPAEPFAFVELTTEGIGAGAGGPGWKVWQDESEKQGPTRVAHATSGGDGGDVLLSSRGDLIVRGLLGPGEGGPGGEVQVFAETGEGEDGSGENLDVVTGNGGRSGGVYLSGSPVDMEQAAVVAWYRASAGRVVAAGGNGVDGAPGGTFDLMVGRHGGQGVLDVNGTRTMLENGDRFQTMVRVAAALFGGDAASNEMDGGPGGELRVRFVDPQPTAELYPVLISNLVGQGGWGWDGCEDDGVNGTNGGRGGRLDLPLAVRGDSISPNAFSGGDGGDGNGPGLGGLRGSDATTGLPIGVEGADGSTCPEDAFYVSPDDLVVPILFGEACPVTGPTRVLVRQPEAPVRTVVIRTAVELDPATTWTGTASTQPSELTLQPGEEREIAVQVGCPSPDGPVTGRIAVEGTWDGGSYTKSVGFQVEALEEAVQLTHPLSAALPTGTLVPLRLVDGGHVFGPEAGCSQEHLHPIDLAGVFVDGEGPYPDPDPSGCGYGPIVTIPVEGTAEPSR